MFKNARFNHIRRPEAPGPSELALFACNTILHSSRYQGNIDILNICSGYGRDAFYLADNLTCHILGIDRSEKAVARARETCPKNLANRVEFLCYEFSRVIDKFDMVFVPNLYHRLKPDERAQLWKTVKRCLKKGGWLFLNAHSTRDPQQPGQMPGAAVSCGAGPEAPDGDGYHLFTREELESDFSFIDINALFERQYDEYQDTGEIHRHVSWMLCGIS